MTEWTSSRGSTRMLWSRPTSRQFQTDSTAACRRALRERPSVVAGDLAAEILQLE
jgi:hypothetical protein